MSTENVYSGN